MKFPDTLRYTSDHEWIRLEDDGKTATIGITDFAQSELGDIVYVEIESDSGQLDAEAVFGTIEAVKTVSELFMPVSGTVVAVNEELEAHPERVNQDPYGAGWMVKIEVDDPAALDGLLTADAYAKEVAG